MASTRTPEPRSRRTRWAPVSLAAAVACDAGLTLHVPRDVGTSAILVLRQREQIDAYAFSAGEETIVEPLRPPRGADELELFLLDLDQTLAELRLGAGWLTLDPGGEALPEPARTRRSLVNGGVQRAWAPAPAPDGLRRLTIAREVEACHTFRVTALVLADTGGAHPNFLFSAPGGGVLLGLRTVAARQRLYLADRTESTLLADLPADLPAAAAFHGGDGTLWLVDGQGRVASGSPERGFALASTATLALGDRIWLTGAPAGPTELFAFGRQGRLARFDGQEWRVLATRTGAETMRWGAVLWLGPGEVVAVGSSAPTFLRYQGGVAHEVVVELNPEDTLSAALDHPQLGLLLGTRYGLVYAQRQGDWQVLGALPELYQVAALASSGGRVLFGGAAGTLKELRGGLDCPAIPLPPRDIDFLAADEPGFVAVQDNIDQEPVQLLFVDP